MTPDDKRAAGWIETAPGHWTLPDGPVERTDATGYGRTIRYRWSDDGQIVAYADDCNLRPSNPDGMGGEVLPPAYAQRRTLTDARMTLAQSRRDAEIARTTAASLADDILGIRRTVVPGFGEVVTDRPGGPVRAIRAARLTPDGDPLRSRGRVLTRAIRAEAVLADALATRDEARGVVEYQTRAVESARDRLRDTFAPARREYNAARQRDRWAATVATETAEQREARLARQRERARKSRAARKAAATATAA